MVLKSNLDVVDEQFDTLMKQVDEQYNDLLKQKRNSEVRKKIVSQKIANNEITLRQLLDMDNEKNKNI